MREKDRLIRELEQLADEWECATHLSKVADEQMNACAEQLREVLADYE